MHFNIISNAGQVLATGSLQVRPDPDGRLRLWLRTERGVFLEGGLVSDDGDLAEAGRVLLSECIRHWRVSSISLRGIQSDR